MSAHTLTLSIQCAGVLPAHLERDLFLSLPPGSPLRAYADEMADALAAAQREAEKAQADAQAERDEAAEVEETAEGLWAALETLYQESVSAALDENDDPISMPDSLAPLLDHIRALSRWDGDDAKAFASPVARARLIGARLWAELRNGRWEARA